MHGMKKLGNSGKQPSKKVEERKKAMQKMAARRTRELKRGG